MAPLALAAGALGSVLWVRQASASQPAPWEGPIEWLQANIQTVVDDPPVHSGKEVARITSIYEVDTNDIAGMLPKTIDRLSVALGGFSADYMELYSWTPLTDDGRCTVFSSLLCSRTTDKGTQKISAPGVGGVSPDGSLEGLTVSDCEAAYLSTPDGSAFAEALEAKEKPWTTVENVWTAEGAAELNEIIRTTDLCVHMDDTRLMYWPNELPNIFITGYRDYYNTRINANTSLDMDFVIWVKGVISTKTAHFINGKFLMLDPNFNDTVKLPLPEITPGNINFSAVWTDELDFEAKIISIRQGGVLAHLPICVEPVEPRVGCMKITHSIFDHPNFTEYSLRTYVGYRNYLFAGLASAEGSLTRREFNVSEGPWPSFEWLQPEVEPPWPWKFKEFPQFQSAFDETCIKGAYCDFIPIAPLPRYLHSAVLYNSWDFENHAKRFLCANYTTKLAIDACNVDCLTNLDCLGGEEYWQGNFYFRSKLFDGDDKGMTPKLGLEDQDCPGWCCRDRRFCLRSRDVLGYEVPFDSPMMLVFGGRSFDTSKHFYDEDGKPHLIYYYCEKLSSEDLLAEWQMCSEMATNDLWRYDILNKRWDFLKPDAAISESTGEPFGVPSPRYGHTAAIIELSESSDVYQKRIYMYIYGGVGPYCTGGVCNDVWRYEVPWAAQAYYPKLADEEIWKRGNMWERLGDAAVGGRYRHAMVATSSMEYIFVYGGQGIGRFYSDLIKYRVSTDVWENVDPEGRFSLVRLMYDYSGAPIQVSLPVEEYEEDVDVRCDVSNDTAGAYRHCAQCPRCGLATAKRADGANLPTDRGDFPMAVFADPKEGTSKHAMVMFGGYRTTWGGDYTEEVCHTTTTTSIKPLTSTTMLQFGEVAQYGDVGGQTTPPQFTGTTANQVVGTFSMAGGYPTTITTTTTIATTTSTVTTTYANVVPIATPPSTLTSTMTMVSTTSRAPTEAPTTAQPTGLPNGTSLGELPVVHGGTVLTGTISNQTGVNVEVQNTASNEGPSSCNNQYYFDDLWIYRDTTDQWVMRVVSGEAPPPRRGHRMIARRADTNDTQLLLFGGHYQDTPFADMWILDLSRDGVDGQWFQIDSYIPGPKPQSVAYHTMVYDKRVNLIIIFGGLHWTETNASKTDILRNEDRRCFKDAQGLPDTYKGTSEEEFLGIIKAKCEASKFCCKLTENWPDSPPPRELDNQTIRTEAGALNLTALSTMCRQSCTLKQFEADFSVEITQGVWTFSTNKCLGNCSGHGVCELSQCICETEYYGADCSMRRCPGSTCYTHSKTKEQFCVECSQHGQCVDGTCMCFPGWGFDDCSAYLCEDNCSSTAVDVHGICIEDFPIHQCHCYPPWGGSTCSELLCLNGCSGRGRCVDGVCHCQAGFYGEDCTVFATDIKE